MRKGIFKDLTGDRFNRWLVLGDRQVTTTPGGWPVTTWLCRCDCGVERRVQTSNLKQMGSCGCLRSEIHRARMRKPPGVATETRARTYYQRNAKRRGLEWKLSDEEFVQIIRGACWYCGEMESMQSDRGYSLCSYNGIDRLDPALGYTPENCVTACKVCNNAKSDLGVVQFREWVVRLHSHLQAKQS